MRRSNLVIAFYLFLVFGSGILVGAFGYRFSTAPSVSAKARPSPEEWRRVHLKEMETRLHLTPDQVTHVNSIMDQTRAKFHEARGKHDQIMKSIREEQTSQIRALLSPEQTAEYTKLRAEWEAKAKAAGNLR